MVEVLADLPGHPPIAQPEQGITYAAKIDKAEARLDFAEPAVAVERRVRAMNPAPGAWFEWQGERIKLLAAEIIIGDGAAAGTVTDDRLTIACGADAIRPVLVQRAGRGVTNAADLLRGFPIPAGSTL